MPGMPDAYEEEKDQLLAYLDHERQQLRLALYGLDDDSARRSPSASALSLGGLVKHMTRVENHWTDLVLATPSPSGRESYQDGFVFRPDETLDDLFAAYEAAADRTDRAVRGVDLQAPVPVPKGVPWYPADLEAWTVRWVVLHLIEETARHAGHADIVRESLDGATCYPLLSAAEELDLRPFVEPWRPAASTTAASDPAGPA